jgi:hypothetical protein
MSKERLHMEDYGKKLKRREEEGEENEEWELL